jgi:MFS family permease
MQAQLKTKLAVFMFLQYFIWGSWYVSMGTYLSKTLQFEGAQIGLAYGAFAIGAMIAPFLVGLLADRYFASERLLAFLGITGGLMLFALPMMTTFSSFYPMLIIYCCTLCLHWLLVILSLCVIWIIKSGISHWLKPFHQSAGSLQV